MPASKPLRALLLTAITGALGLLSGSALAEPEFPGALQEAAGMSCVPLCTMCHLTNPGQAGNYVRPLAGGLMQNGLVIGDPNSIKVAWGAYKVKFPEQAAKVVKGISPGFAPADDQNVCGPIYGCAVASAKPVKATPDYTGVIWAAGAVLVGAVLRRRKKAR